jgi:hypothetical protein
MTMPGHMSPRRRMKTPSSGQCPRFCPCYQNMRYRYDNIAEIEQTGVKLAI